MVTFGTGPENPKVGVEVGAYKEGDVEVKAGLTLDPTEDPKVFPLVGELTDVARTSSNSLNRPCSNIGLCRGLLLGGMGKAEELK